MGPHGKKNGRFQTSSISKKIKKKFPFEKNQKNIFSLTKMKK